MRLFKRIAKGSNGECANKKAREISLLSFLVSCIVVVSLNNNLVNSLNGLSENHIALEFDVLSFPFEVDSYLRYDLKSNDLSEILIDPGQAFWLLVVAFFLTFGSQFFHDLIDRLYLLKEAKKGLANIRKNFQVEDRNHELELENRYFQMRDLNQEKNGVSDPTRLAVIDNEINKIAKRAKELTKEIYGN
ncbi:hypothetical protein [Ekhidna lutea]|uniref:hypothetical protein n=1 Tax=Ekhidna lutea TaxID=447679 RepID=UPI00117FA70B|nr:hypothetical protein [Ekhidna lutea]